MWIKGNEKATSSIQTRGTRWHMKAEPTAQVANLPLAEIPEPTFGNSGLEGVSNN